MRYATCRTLFSKTFTKHTAMKSRLAKKISRTPWNKLAPRWLNAFLLGGAKIPPSKPHFASMTK